MSAPCEGRAAIRAAALEAARAASGHDWTPERVVDAVIESLDLRPIYTPVRDPATGARTLAVAFHTSPTPTMLVTIPAAEAARPRQGDS